MKTNGSPPKSAPAYLTSTTPYDGKTLSEWIGELSSSDATTRSRAVEAVRRYGPDAKDAIPFLVKILNDPRDPAFPAVFETLSVFGPAADAAIPRLTELLRHNQVEVRRSAVETLGRLGPATGRAISTLIDLLASDRGGLLPQQQDLVEVERILGRGQAEGSHLGRPGMAKELELQPRQW